MQNDLCELALKVGQVLSRQGLRLVTAESCTGGWIAKAITDIPGCSAWFSGGFVSYGDKMKQQQFNIEQEILQQNGAVSQEVVEAMAKGALEKSDAHVSVAVSGIAGPDGGSADKPVGTVWFAWARLVPPSLESNCELLAGDRTQVRHQTVDKALKGIIQLIGGQS